MPFVYDDQSQTSKRFAYDDESAKTPPKVGQPEPSTIESIGRGVEDLGGAGYNLARGMVMGPLANVAGLGAIPLHAAGLIDTPPTDVQSKVAHAGEYTPKTAFGRGLEEYNPLALLSKGVGKTAEAAGSAVERSPFFAGSPIAGSLAGYATKGAIEQAPTLLGAKTGAKIAENIPGKQAALDIAKGENLPKDTLRDTLQSAGYRTPAEFGLKARASEAAGRTKEQKIDSAWNNANATKRVGEEVGVKDGQPLIDEVRENAKQEQYKRYDALKNAVGPELQVPNQFRETLSNTLRGLKDESDVNPSVSSAIRVLEGFLKRVAPRDPALEPKPGTASPNITRTIEKVAQEQPGPRLMRTIEQASSETPGIHAYGDRELLPPPNVGVATGRVPTLHTNFVMGQISRLRREAKDDYAKRETNLGDARMGVAFQLENLFTENLAQKNRALVPEWMDARKKLAQLHLLDRITDDATGKVDLPKLGNLSQRPEYRGALTGEFKLAADLARNYTKAAQRVTGEAPARLTVLDGLFVTYGLGGALLGHPGALLAPAIEVGGRLAVPYAAEKGLLQNRTPSYQIGRMRRVVAPVGIPAAGLATSNQIEPPPQ